MNQESDFLWPSLTLRAQYYEGFQKNLSRGITAHFTTQFNVGSWADWQVDKIRLQPILKHIVKIYRKIAQLSVNWGRIFQD